MSSDPKYVIFLHEGLEWPIVLPPSGVPHKHMESLGHIVAAGFCRPADGWACYGESLSLGIKSRGSKDQAMLQAKMGPASAATKGDEQSQIRRLRGLVARWAHAGLGVGDPGSNLTGEDVRTIVQIADEERVSANLAKAA